MKEKYLLCRTNGGFNDNLCQIEKCYRYAKMFDRKLFVDTNRGVFAENLKNFFIPPSDISFESLDFLSPPFDVYPNFLIDDIHTYLPTSWQIGVPYINGKAIAIDFSIPYNEQILVNHGVYGGSYGIFLLGKLKFTKAIRQYIQPKIAALGEYDACHVRHNEKTYTTDYRTFFHDLQNKIGKKILLCTDSREVQEYAKDFFGEKYCSLFEVPDMQEKELIGRNITDENERHKLNLNTLTELLALACCKNLYLKAIQPRGNIPINKFSGFSELARCLHDRTDIVRKLLFD